MTRLPYKEVVAGYWRPTFDSPVALPWPEENILSDTSVILALADLVMLETHPHVEIISFMGYSNCRLCGILNGTREFALMHKGTLYRWPIGLKHYIAEHRVALPRELRELL